MLPQRREIHFDHELLQVKSETPSLLSPIAMTELFEPEEFMDDYLLTPSSSFLDDHRRVMLTQTKMPSSEDFGADDILDHDFGDNPIVSSDDESTDLEKKTEKANSKRVQFKEDEELLEVFEYEVESDYEEPEEIPEFTFVPDWESEHDDDESTSTLGDDECNPSLEEFFDDESDSPPREDNIIVGMPHEDDSCFDTDAILDMDAEHDETVDVVSELEPKEDASRSNSKLEEDSTKVSLDSMSIVSQQVQEKIGNWEQEKNKKGFVMRFLSGFKKRIGRKR